MTTSSTIQYEIPLSSFARGLLRLERIFRECQIQCAANTESSHFYVLRQIFILINFFERGDFKAELIKTLNNEISYFAKLKDNPAVDLTKLDTFVRQLAKLNHWAKSLQGKIGHELLEDEFISQSKNKLTQEAARLSFDAPAVKCFLAQPEDTRQAQLLEWLKAFKGVQTSVDVILRLSRETSQFQTVSVDDGYYEEEMTRDQYRFIAINLPAGSNLFPEVSTGPTRFSIHFKQLTDRLTSEKFEGPIDFNIAKYR
jgi:cell division protein ZapD